MDAPAPSPPAVPPPSQPTTSPPPPAPSKPPPQPSPSSLSLPNLSAFLTHLTAHLSKTSTLDTTLLTATYTLTLLSHLLPRPTSPLSPSKRPSPLTRLTTTIPPLTSLLSDLRVHLRLWGLIPLLNAAVKLYGPEGGRGNGREGKSKPSPSYTSTIKKTVAWTQILSLILFQSLENTAFLAHKGIISLKSTKRKNVELWCSRAWMTYTSLELGKLAWEGQARWERKLDREREMKMRRAGEVLKEMPKIRTCQDGFVEGLIKKGAGEEEGRENEKLAGEVESGEREDEEEEAYWRTWKKNIAVNAAYAPMTVHYSRENPLLADRTIAVLGCVVAWWSFGDAWRGSA